MNNQIWIRAYEHSRPIAYAVLACALVAGCSDAPPPPSPPQPAAKPVLVSRDLNVNLIDPNQMVVRVRNDGEAGPVMIEIERTERVVRIERGESGVEKGIREALTRQIAPPFQRAGRVQVGWLLDQEDSYGQG